MTLLEVAKHALEAMEDAMYRADTHEFYDAKESLRYAIEQAEQAEQEPDGISWLKRDSGYFTAPTPRKPLTDLELRAVFILTNTAEPLAEGWPGLERFARAIERAHGIGEQHE